MCMPCYIAIFAMYQVYAHLKSSTPNGVMLTETDVVDVDDDDDDDLIYSEQLN